MSDSNQSNPQDKQPGEVLDLIREIAEKSASAEFYFRGEPENYPRVSSSLYRVFENDIKVEQFDIEIVEKEILGQGEAIYTWNRRRNTHRTPTLRRENEPHRLYNRL